MFLFVEIVFLRTKCFFVDCKIYLKRSVRRLGSIFPKESLKGSVGFIKEEVLETFIKLN